MKLIVVRNLVYALALCILNSQDTFETSFSSMNLLTIFPVPFFKTNQPTTTYDIHTHQIFTPSRPVPRFNLRFFSKKKSITDRNYVVRSDLQTATNCNKVLRILRFTPFRYKLLEVMNVLWIEKL